jgi:hypothetical protein
VRGCGFIHAHWRSVLYRGHIFDRRGRQLQIVNVLTPSSFKCHRFFFVLASRVAQWELSAGPASPASICVEML